MPGLADAAAPVHRRGHRAEPARRRPGSRVVDYGESVLERFANPAIAPPHPAGGHGRLAEAAAAGAAHDRATGARPARARAGRALVVAAWMRFARGVADDGRALPLDDPLADADPGRARAGAGDSPDGLVDALFGLRAVFPAELAADDDASAPRGRLADRAELHGVEATAGGRATGSTRLGGRDGDRRGSR